MNSTIDRHCAVLGARPVYRKVSGCVVITNSFAVALIMVISMYTSLFTVPVRWKLLCFSRPLIKTLLVPFRLRDRYISRLPMTPVTEPVVIVLVFKRFTTMAHTAKLYFYINLPLSIGRSHP